MAGNAVPDQHRGFGLGVNEEDNNNLQPICIVDHNEKIMKRRDVMFSDVLYIYIIKNNFHNIITDNLYPTLFSKKFEEALHVTLKGRLRIPKPKVTFDFGYITNNSGGKIEHRNRQAA